MAIERKFINEVVKKAKIDRYLENELQRSGCGDIDIKRTPLGTRVVISAIKPGMVIGRKGKNIQMITDTLRDTFGMDNPQVEVEEVSVPEFNPAIMARQLAGMLERGLHFRRAAYSMVKQIMNAGAVGVQIEITGKISGSRARNEKFKKGYIKHCGETARLYVKESTAQAVKKAGVLGIKIKITPPQERLFNELSLHKKPEVTVEEKKKEEKEEPTAEEKTVEKPAKEKKESKPKKEKKAEEKPEKAKPDKEKKPAAKKAVKKKPAAKKKTVPKKTAAKKEDEVKKSGDSKK